MSLYAFAGCCCGVLFVILENEMALLVLLLLLLLPQAAPPEKCSLSGTVVDSITGEPLEKVRLRLISIGREAVASATVSDARGHFTLVGLDEGVYRLLGHRSGYLEIPYGARRAGHLGTTLRLEAGQALSDLTFKLVPGSAIGGTIRDSDGEPLEGADVKLGRIAYSARGTPHLDRVRSAYSDDRGEYRFHGLWPGKYYISAVNRQSSWYSGEVDRSANKGPREASVTTFYPGVVEPTVASSVEVFAGTRASGIDVTLLRRPAVCVTGRVTLPERTVRHHIEIEAENAAMGNFRRSTKVKNADGDFEFCHVPTGSYVLWAHTSGLSARTPVNVGSVDVNDSRLILSPGADIQGRVIAEGGEEPNLRAVRFEISRDGKERSFGPVSEDGTFTLDNWIPGHYDVGISAAPEGYYLKSIRSNEVDVLTDGLTISGPGTVHLEIVLSPDGSELSGVVLDEDQQPVAGATVLLAPDQRSRFDLFKIIATDQRGFYRFGALAPGNYKVFAWDDVEPNAWYDPGFLRSYEKQAEEAILKPRTHAVAILRIAAEPDAQ